MHLIINSQLSLDFKLMFFKLTHSFIKDCTLRFKMFKSNKMMDLSCLDNRNKVHLVRLILTLTSTIIIHTPLLHILSHHQA